LVDLIKSLKNDFKYPHPKQPLTFKDKNDRPKSTESTSNDYASNNNNNYNPNIDLNSNNNYNYNGIASSIYWMLQDPIDEAKYSLNKSFFELITNKQIDSYNRAAINLLYYSPIQVWSSSRIVSQAYNKDSSDGLKIGPFALSIVSFSFLINNSIIQSKII
jgi:hypothetical protein